MASASVPPEILKKPVIATAASFPSVSVSVPSLKEVHAEGEDMVESSTIPYFGGPVADITIHTGQSVVDDVNDVVPAVSVVDECLHGNPDELFGFEVSHLGNRFKLPLVTMEVLERSRRYASSYHRLLIPFGVSEIPSLETLADRLIRLQSYFAPTHAESEALLDAQGFTWPDGMFDRDKDLLDTLGSLDAVLEHHASYHREHGINEDRVFEWLSSDPNAEKLMYVAAYGAVVDVDDDFVEFRRESEFRQLQQRLLPVYRKHAYKMWNNHKALLFRLSDLSPAILEQLHTANECHWVPKPDSQLGRFIIDCSNVNKGRVPLNGISSKEKGIARYQKVVLPSFSQIMVKWNQYRIRIHVKWSDMIIFKDDVSNCFNQVFWSIPSSKRLCTMIDHNTLYIMITGGFGTAVMPMVWSMFGEAITNVVRLSIECPIDVYVDDSVGAGIPSHVDTAITVNRKVTVGVVGPGAINIEKARKSPREEVLGFLVDLLLGKIRPKDKAIDKLFFLFFSFDASDPQPLQFWQCLMSMVNMYSPVLRGMRPFVAAIQHMTCRCGASGLIKARATPSAVFAIEMWRAASVLLVENRDAMAVPIDVYLASFGASDDLAVRVVSDASPWRVAAGLYHPQTGQLLGWSTLLLPFASGNEHRFQTQREYLGHLFSILLILAYFKPSASSPMLTYRWVNDNTGALEWAANNKCSSLSSQFACLAVSQLNLLSNIWLMDSVYLPGIDMGEIDAMSRRETHEAKGMTMDVVCPSLVDELYVPVDSQAIVSLFQSCDPSKSVLVQSDFHANFLRVHEYIRVIIESM